MLQSRLDGPERSLRNVSLRDMMRRATAAAARGLVEDTREGESSGIAIPTLNWPPDPSAPFDATARAGKNSSYH